MTLIRARVASLSGEPDWDFFLPDDGEAYPEPGDFWIESDDDE